MTKKTLHSPEWPGLTEHRVRVLQFVEAAGKWVTNKEIAAGSNVSRHSVRNHTKALAGLGVFDVTPVHSGHFYKRAETPNREYVDALTQAAEVFGLNMPLLAIDNECVRQNVG